MIFDVYLCHHQYTDDRGKLCAALRHVAVARGPLDPRVPPEKAHIHLGAFDDITPDQAINQSIAFGHRRKAFNQLPKKV